MMNYGWNWGMMGGFGGFAVITWLAFTADLILVGIWLWKQITKK